MAMMAMIATKSSNDNDDDDNNNNNNDDNVKSTSLDEIVIMKEVAENAIKKVDKVFDKNLFFPLEKSYNKLIPSAYKADLWRLCVIYEYGGVYSDASQIFKIPIDQIIDTKKEFCIIKDKTFNNYQGLQIALFSSVKRHPFLLKYIFVGIKVKDSFFILPDIF